MKILILSFHFPPFNAIGALRPGKTAKYLYRNGHEIMIVTADKQNLYKNLAIEVPTELVSYAKWLDVDAMIKKIFGYRYKNLKQNSERGSLQGKKISDLVLWFRRQYRSFFHIPDGQIGWYPYAVSTGREILRKWQPDIIFASAMPYTSLLVAKKLSQKFGVPWVAELRDLWVDNHNREYGSLRNWLDAKMERRTLETASGLVTVSEPLAEKLRLKYSQPCVVIPNGFDPDDYDIGAKSTDRGTLKIVYTGGVHRGKQNLSSLFKALECLREKKNSVAVQFYGTNLGFVEDLARQYRCCENVEVHAPIPYKESIRAQQKADILLLLLWNDPSEKGIFTGKFFEYLGAKRPILAIGPSDNVAAQTIIERRAGVVSNEPDTIAESLKMWIEKKQKGIPIESPPEEATNGFTREEQAKKLAEFLEQVLEVSRRTK